MRRRRSSTTGRRDGLWAQSSTRRSPATKHASASSTVRNPDTPLRESELAPDLFVEAGGRVRSRKLHDSLSGVRGVGGRIHGDVDHFSNATVGVQLAPTIVDPVIYANDPGNVEAAIHERVDKKQKQPKLSKEDKQMFGSVTSAAMGKSGPKEARIFTKEAVQRVMEGLFSVTDLKSKKWSEERFNQRLKKLYAEASPTFKFTTKIKLEPMGTDAQGQPKPPRFLIADGDPGQIMALVVISMFEKIFDKAQSERAIKGKARRLALSEIAKHLRPHKGTKHENKKAGLVEGDGSAWDTCCSAELRGIVENPILKHIAEHVFPYFLVPPQWNEAHLEANDQKKLRLIWKNHLSKYVWEILAARRSTHRGTSLLNQWINFVCWIVSIAREPFKLLNPQTTSFIDKSGVRRWWKGKFEGDDSLCRFVPKLTTDPLYKIIVESWDRFGFNMKLVLCDKKAELCGTHYVCEDGDIEGRWVPDLRRCLKNWGISCTPGVIEAFKNGKGEPLVQAKVAACLSRALDYAGILPSLSNKFLETALADAKCNTHDVMPKTIISPSNTGNHGLRHYVVFEHFHLDKNN